jgi:hypothetical protein
MGKGGGEVKPRSDAIDLDRVRELLLQGYTRNAIAHKIGKSIVGVWGAVRRLGLAPEIVEEANGRLVDALCESGEPDRRTTVYTMVCCGTTDENIIDTTGYDPAEVAKFRAEMPAWWSQHVGMNYEYTEDVA